MLYHPFSLDLIRLLKADACGQKKISQDLVQSAIRKPSISRKNHLNPQLSGTKEKDGEELQVAQTCA